MSNYSSIKLYLRIRSTDGNIRDCLLLTCAFIISDVTQSCSSVCANPLKTTFSVFRSFFLVKLSKSRSLKLNISRTAWPILMILVSFCRILNSRSDEINLFWRCSSPLTLLIQKLFQVHLTDNTSLDYWVFNDFSQSVSSLRPYPISSSSSLIIMFFTRL